MVKLLLNSIFLILFLDFFDNLINNLFIFFLIYIVKFLIVNNFTKIY